MKIFAIVIITQYFMISNIFSQIQFSEHTIIDSSGIWYSRASVIDLDNDGDIDIIAAVDNKIEWYENDGHENFTVDTITTTLNDAVDVYTADVDSDGDIDILSASLYDDKIAWYENDGSENFTSHTITNRASRAKRVRTADIDGDGDIDVLSYYGHYQASNIDWYENDGSENFTTHTITDSIDYPTSLCTADLDGDGDIDVLSSSGGDDIIEWYENDGSGNFSTHMIADSVHGGEVCTVDMDSDGDIDVVSGSLNKISWYENDGMENFTMHIINNITTSNGIDTADMDGDGDVDVLSSFSYHYGRIRWFENDGNYNFTSHIIGYDLYGGNYLQASDIDSDGDMDVQALFKFRAVWYENLGSAGTISNEPKKIPVDILLHNNYPNPFNPSTTIEFTLPQSEFVELKVYNILGKEVSNLVSKKLNQGNHFYTFDGKNLVSGIYYYQLKASDFREVKKMILLK